MISLMGIFGVGFSLLSDFLHKSIVPTDHFQKSLPRLPIPELEKTCSRYLDTQKAFLSDEKFQQTKLYTEMFEKEIGKGRYCIYIHTHIHTAVVS